MLPNVIKHPADTNETPRDYLFDNLRATLIIFVVWGHLLTSMLEASWVIKSIYFFIFFFHMPAMAFVSGYFSKNVEKSRNNAFVGIFIPFVIWNIINYVFKMLILQQEYYGFRFFRPYWGLWYLLVLFLWKFFLKDLIKIKYLLPISFLFALLNGYSKEFSDYMALGRLFNFLPFFLLGFYYKKQQVDKLRRLPKIASLVIIVVALAVSFYIVKRDIFPAEVLYLRRPYPEDNELRFMAYRGLVYVIAILMMIAMINLISARKTFLSRIGTSTMTIYILHLFTIPVLEKFELFKEQPTLYIGYSIIMTAIIVFIYSQPQIIKLYDTLMDKITSLVLKREQ